MTGAARVLVEDPSQPCLRPEPMRLTLDGYRRRDSQIGRPRIAVRSRATKRGRPALAAGNPNAINALFTTGIEWAWHLCKTKPIPRLGHECPRTGTGGNSVVAGSAVQNKANFYTKTGIDEGRQGRRTGQPLGPSAPNKPNSVRAAGGTSTLWKKSYVKPDPKGVSAKQSQFPRTGGTGRGWQNWKGNHRRGQSCETKPISHAGTGAGKDGQGRKGNRRWGQLRQTKPITRRGDQRGLARPERESAGSIVQNKANFPARPPAATKFILSPRR